VHEGDLLICARNGSRALVGKTAIITGLQEITAFGAFMAIFRSTLNSYLYHFICSPLFRLMIDEVNTTTINQITQTNLRSTLAPIPPRAEQHRIVAKVDELMKLCGRLEAARAERETRRGELVAASHHYLDNGACAEDLPAHAHFYLNHLSTITTLPEQIPALRRTILSLAVRGQLVPQGPAGESAAELLTRIQAEKAKLIEEGLLRKEKPLATIADDKVPFAIPTTWRWARIGTCSLLTDYGTSVKSDQVSDGVPILAMGNIQDGQVVLNDRRKVPQGIDDLPHLFLKRFDLLYNRTNSAELVGKTGIYLGDDDAYTFASYLIRIRFLNNLTSPLYANLAMNAPYFRATQIVPELQQQCGQANVNGSKLRNMLIPVPPFAEQLRIVAKVDELTALCDRLEKRLSDTQAESGHLLESVLHHALNDKHSPVISQPIAQTAKC
jgi:type I restriction enzyme S subunit